MSFVADLTAFAQKTNLNMDAVVRKVVLDLGTSLVMKSPVGDADYWKSKPPKGYVGGRFRGNWQYAFNHIPTGALPDIDPSGGLSIDRVSSGVLGQTDVRGIHYVANNLPYAQRLEEGHSRQAPNGMVALTVVEFQSMFAKAVQK